jgi:RNA polymerase sigma-B factor
VRSPSRDLIAQTARRERDTVTVGLLRAYHRDGDTEARDRLVRLYLPLVEKLAHRYRRFGAEHDDLVQAGSVGLLNAIERYDRRRGGEFAAFAVPTIAGEIKRHLRDRTATLRLPRPLQEAGVQLPQARSHLTSQLGRTPTDDELAGELGIDTEDLAYLDAAGRMQALGDPDSLLARSPEGADDLELSEERLELSAAFQALEPAEQRILYLRYVKDLSRRQASEQLGISEGQLSRRTQTALDKLRAQIELVSSPPSSGAAAIERGDGERAPARPHEPRTTKAESTPGRSGRLLLRMPRSLHAELARAAEREALSLNKFIATTLSDAIEAPEAQQRKGREASGSRPAGGTWLRAAFIANIAVVIAVGVVAVILLVAAWNQGW